MENEIIKIIQENTQKDIKVTKKSNLHTDLAIDSLKMMKIVSEVEQKLNVKVSYSKLKDISSVEDFINSIN